MNTTVTIKVKGHLDKKWEESFDGMKISYEEDDTIISGNIEDQAKLHGILNLIRDLNLKLISVNPIQNK